VLEGHRILAAFYRAIVDQAGVRLGEVMTAVADGAPVLVHCAAGKDRTGTAVALLLDLIGTETEAIVEDFLRTNDALDEVMMQLTGRTAVEAKARTDIPPGIGDAPEPSIRELLRHLQSKGGAAAVLRRTTDQATLDDVITTLTS
jgi:protein-tyrosine phosphatase